MKNHKIIEKFHEGHSIDAYKVFGAHFDFDETPGVRFCVYAPHAQAVYLIGDFNHWHNSHLMDRHEDGTWSTFVANLQEYALYKYRIHQSTGEWVEKSDPFAFYSEMRPKSSNLVVNLQDYHWKDQAWTTTRSKYFHEALNIYEVHLGSWMKHGYEWLNYRQMAEKLIPYVKSLAILTSKSCL